MTLGRTEIILIMLSSHPTAALALIILVTTFPNSISKPQELSDDIINNKIRRSVNDGFTITKEDKEYFERLISDNDVDNVEAGEVKEEVRIVKGQEAKLGKYGQITYSVLEFQTTVIM